MDKFSSVQLLSCVQLFVTPWTAACKASLSITNSRSLPKLMSIESVRPSNHVIPFSSLFQSFQAPGFFQMSQFFFASGSQSICFHLFKYPQTVLLIPGEYLAIFLSPHNLFCHHLLNNFCSFCF